MCENEEHFIRVIRESFADQVVSVLSYNLFSREQFVVVLSDRVENVPQLVAHVQERCQPPTNTQWVRRRELFELTLGSVRWGVGWGEEPFASYWVKTHSTVRYGQDIRNEIPPLVKPTEAVLANLSLWLCYTTSKEILEGWAKKNYREVMRVLMRDMTSCMALALFTRGLYDPDNIHHLFFDTFQDTDEAKLIRDVMARYTELRDVEDDDIRWKSLSYDSAFAYLTLLRFIRKEAECQTQQ